MKLRELIEKEDIAYHCDTLEKAERFIKWLVDNGYDINSQEVANYWKYFKEKNVLYYVPIQNKKIYRLFCKIINL